MIKVRRTIGVLAATVMAGALPVLVASPAHATSGDCTNYMRNMGYRVGSQVISACDSGAKNTAIGTATCQSKLVLAGLSNGNHIREACYQAARG